MPQGEYAFYIWDRINDKWIGFPSTRDLAVDPQRMVHVMDKKISGLDIQVFKVTGTKTFIAKERRKPFFVNYV